MADQRYVTKGPGEPVHALSERLSLRLGLDLFECTAEGLIIPTASYAIPRMMQVGNNMVPELEDEPSAEEAAEAAGGGPAKKAKKASKKDD